MQFKTGINTFRFYPALLLFLVFCACGSDAPKKEKNSFSEEKVKQTFVKANQQLVVKENDEMDYYQRSHNMPFIKTTSGIRYYVYKASAKGDSIKNDDIIKINYKVSLLDGTECYSSKTDGMKEFMVGREDIEDGLHKAVLFLKAGDKALVLIPSHLAHGLLGDSKKIPPQSPIVYDVEIVSVKKSLN